MIAACSFAQISGVSALPDGRLLASAKASSAFSTLSPNIPSISPGEKCARSSSTWSFTASGLSFSSGGSLPVKLAALIVSALKALDGLSESLARAAPCASSDSPTATMRLRIASLSG